MGAGKIVKLTWADGPEQTTETVTGFRQISETGWREYSASVSGFGTIDRQKFFWRKTGNDVLIRGEFRSGTTTASFARISLPSPLISIQELGRSGPIGEYREVVGTFFTSGTNRKGTLYSQQWESFLSFALVSGGNPATRDTLTAVNGDNVAPTSGINVSVNARIPILDFEF